VPGKPAGEVWLTVSAVLARDLPWPEAGHEIAWIQIAGRACREGCRCHIDRHRRGEAERGKDSLLVSW
jgi:hypothetical protein